MINDDPSRPAKAALLIQPAGTRDEAAKVNGLTVTCRITPCRIYASRVDDGVERDLHPDRGDIGAVQRGID